MTAANDSRWASAWAFISGPGLMIGLAALVAYFTAENQSAVQDARQQARIEVLDTRITILDNWRTLTESNRFSDVDGQRLRGDLTADIDRHAQIDGHSNVIERLARIETRLDALD